MAPATEDISPSARLDDLFQPWNRSDAPGLVVGVSRAGELLYRRGFGMASLETSVANGPATRMRIGSTSKHFTCLLLLLLREDGKIDLDAPIGTYIHELIGDVGRPTVRQLMMHRGGGRDYVDLFFLTHGFNARPPGAALIMQARQTEQNFAPGEAMIYNNGGYHLLSIAAERAGGAPFETLLDERLFKPLGMLDTLSAPGDHVILPGMATLHMSGSDGRWRRGLFPSEEVKGRGRDRLDDRRHAGLGGPLAQPRPVWLSRDLASLTHARGWRGRRSRSLYIRASARRLSGSADGQPFGRRDRRLLRDDDASGPGSGRGGSGQRGRQAPIPAPWRSGSLISYWTRLWARPPPRRTLRTTPAVSANGGRRRPAWSTA